jgi:hypothetical protein
MIEMIPTTLWTYVMDGIYFGDIPIASTLFFQSLERNEVVQEAHWLPVTFCIGETTK